MKQISKNIGDRFRVLHKQPQFDNNLLLHLFKNQYNFFMMVWSDDDKKVENPQPYILDQMRLRSEILRNLKESLDMSK